MTKSVLEEHLARYRPTTPFHLEMFAYLPEAERELILNLQDIVAKANLGGRTIVITVGNVKGGVAKTTTTVYLALILSFVLDNILIVDADGENRQALGWSASSQDAWPGNVRVAAWAGLDPVKQVEITPTEMRERIKYNVASGRFNVILVDTGPQKREFLEAALEESDEFLVTVSHKPLDKAKLPASVDLAAGIEKRRARPLYVTVLVAQAKKEVAEFRKLIEMMDTDRINYFQQTISPWENYSNAAGTLPKRFDEYLPVAIQLVEAWVEAEEEEEVPA